MSAPSALASTSKKQKKPVPQPKAPLPLPSSFSKGQAEKAVSALFAHNAKVAAKQEDEELISKDEHVWLVVNTKHGSTRRSLNPIRIQLPNPALPPPPQTSVCLIVKSPQRTYKDLLAASNIKFISRVVGVEKLKGKFKPYEARRELMRDHEVWLCDERVVPMMPKLLGKMFFEAKKQPIPVNVLRKDLKAELGRAISSTYFHPTTGTSAAIRISTPSTTSASDTLSNILSALPQIAAHIQDGWENILSVGIKTSSSVMLPIWASALSGRFDQKAPSTSSASVDKMAVKAPIPAAQAPEKAAPTKTAPEKKKPASSTSTEEKPKKKSSTIGSGSGGAGKKAKASVVGGAPVKKRKATSKL